MLHKTKLSYSNQIIFVISGIDLIGPLPEINGKKYIVTAICYFSKYVEAKAIESKSATEIAEFLFELICR